MQEKLKYSFLIKTIGFILAILSIIFLASSFLSLVLCTGEPLSCINGAIPMVIATMFSTILAVGLLLHNKKYTQLVLVLVPLSLLYLAFENIVKQQSQDPFFEITLPIIILAAVFTSAFYKLKEY